MKIKRYEIFLVLLVVAVVTSQFWSMRIMPIRLSGVEVREYRGVQLSSVASDFRENSIKGPQQIDINTYTLKISGLVLNPREYTYDEVIGRQNYEKLVTLNCVEGWSATILWQGVLVMDLISEARHLPTANTVIFHAYDGYTTSLPLAYIMDREIIMAYKMNNVTLPAERGFPFQLVAEDKWGYKWCKWITMIEISDDPNYRGYWESRGYSNTGNLDEPYLE
ncbi:MAG: molybdopterin-dependent oxidoreductase [Candidatus Bathyarchaeota archaeon]|nr:MAG: molybdopterin-dependent oxidoreductase [Candidatus Bathyarchaeota archaeon]